jgi:hypothetical protein
MRKARLLVAVVTVVSTLLGVCSSHGNRQEYTTHSPPHTTIPISLIQSSDSRILLYSGCDANQSKNVAFPLSTL